MHNDLTIIQQLRTSLSRMESALSIIQDSIVWTNKEGTVLWCNAVFDRCVEKPHIMCLNKKIIDILPLRKNNQILDWGAYPVNPVNIEKIKEQDFFSHYIFNCDGKQIKLHFQTNCLESPQGMIWVTVIRDITDQLDALAEKEAYQQQLAFAERHAGMADIATSVLHNIGNVLNSVNTTCAMIDEKINQIKIDNLSKIVKMLEDHHAHIGEFMTQDPKGSHIIEYLSHFSNIWKNTQNILQKDIQDLSKHITHIRNIVKAQNALAKLVGVEEETDIPGLADEILHVHQNKFDGSNIQIVRYYHDIKKPMIDKIKVMQILMNLIKNSIESLHERNHLIKEITITIKQKDDQDFLILVEDNGLGIKPEDMKKIFSLHFTSKPDGHGFGLHTSAMAAKELGGRLSVKSAGVNQGATFILELPYLSPIRKDS